MWERALRKAAVPVAYTSGFSPRPKLSFGLALPTGCESLAEYLDIELGAPMPAMEVSARLEGQFPRGIEITASGELEDGGGSLQQDVTSCGWEMEVPDVDLSTLEAKVAAAMSADSIPVRRERKGREETDDLRPALLELSAGGIPGGACMLSAELATRPRGVRPTELGRALGFELGLCRRTHQWIEGEGSRTEPLAPDAARPRVASELAS